MHPLDAVSLDGFDMVARSESVLRRSFEDVWTLLALGNEEPLTLPDGASHMVIERFGRGEHRCSTLRTAAGRDVCSRGFRALAHREVLEYQCRSAEDHLVRVTYTPLYFGRTRMTSYAGVRPARRLGGPSVEVCNRWTRVLTHRHDVAERYLNTH
jgi:hypothetical protein